MKTVAVYYILYTIVYLYFGKGDVYWGIFNMFSILVPFCFFMYKLTKRYNPNKGDIIWINTAIEFTVIRLMYTTAMPFALIDWVYDTSKILAIIFAIWMITKLLLVKRTGCQSLR